jgi:N-dimethylarginine dimethylaminohydrolase
MRMLMCRPAFYGIEYEINPWMNRSRRSKYLLAQEQWRVLHRLLQDRLHVDVSLIEPKPGLPDMAFTANAGFVWKNKFIVSNFRHEVRRGEAAHCQKWFAVRGFEIFHLPAEDHFEGEGDLLMCGDVLFAGYPFRSSITSHRRLAEIIRATSFH